MDEWPPRARRLLLSGAGEQLRHVTALNGTAAAGHAHDILGIVTREEAAGYVTSGIQALNDVQLRVSTWQSSLMRRPSMVVSSEPPNQQP